MSARRLPWVLVLALGLAALGAPPVGADTATSMGDRGGEGATPFTGLAQSPEANLFTGSLSTRVQIQVPPGRKNLTPKLSLQYSSNGGPSPFGYGWELPLGRIERSTKWGTPRCTGAHTDDFVLVLPDGAVELKNDPPGSNYYRPVVEESYLRAEKFVQENYWEVRDRSGLRYVFGKYGTAVARLFTGNGSFLSQQGGVCHLTTAWALLHVEDANGNSMDVSYWTIDNVFYPVEIRYGGNVRTGLGHTYGISFLYSVRPDFLLSYHGGVRSRLWLRARQIDVYAHVPSPNQLVRTYSLTYHPDSALAGYHSTLASVQATGYPAQLFSYAGALEGFVSQGYSPPDLSPYRLRRRDGSHEVEQTLLDMNGDGFVDVVRWMGPEQPWRVYPGAPGGPETSPVSWNLPAVIGSSNQIRNVWVHTGDCEDGWACTARDTLDLTGDGIPDYVDASDEGRHADCGGRRRWKVYPGRAFDAGGSGGGFQATCADDGVTPCSSDNDCRGVGNFCGTRWCSPEAFVQERKREDLFQDVFDMNADGLVDLVVAESPDWPGRGSTNWRVYLNTGTGFEVEPLIYTAPFPTLQDDIFDDDFTNHMLVDFNGDGLTDLVGNPPGGNPQSYDPRCGGSSTTPVRCLDVWLNTGQGFATPYVVPVPGLHSSGVVTHGVRYLSGPSKDRQTLRDLFDVNGDGLPDWVRVDPQTQQWRVILNTGGLFEPLDGTSEPRIWPGGSGPLRLQDGRDTLIDLFDFNGDGLLDRVQWNSNTLWTIHKNNSKRRPNLLVAMENGFLGRTYIRYAPSTTCGKPPVRCDHTGGDGVPDLPFVSWVVSAIAETDGSCTLGPDAIFEPMNSCLTNGQALLERFTYQDGRFDAAAREFRGFRSVYRISADNNFTHTIFAQDNAAKGRVLHTYVYGGATSLIRHDFNTWNTAAAGAHTQLWLALTGRITYDGQQPGTVPHVLLTTHDPPDAYGNILRSRSAGGPFDPQPVDTFTEYATAVGQSHVHDKPRRTYSMRNGTVFSEQWFYYDGYSADADYGKVGAGNLTRVVSRLGSNPADYPETRMTYDAYGNITAVTDALGRLTRTDYDAFALYPRDQYNALGHKTTTVMDYRWGKPATVTDPNGARTTYTYDAAGRLECLRRPLSQSACSTAYTYTFASAPGELSRVDVDQEEPSHPSGYLRTTRFFDALGRHRETRTFRVVDGSGQTVVVDQVQYDLEGRVLVRQEPRLASSGPSAWTVYYYSTGGYLDPLGRVQMMVAPNGTVRRWFYRGRVRVEVDEAGVERRRQLDPYGRVEREEVWRPGDTQAYAYTEYTYDGAGRVLTTTQNGNPNTTITHTYDQLGRKVQTVDPSSGTWTYGYDKVGNLIRQNDPKGGQQLQFCYDKLNRITLECPIPNDSTSIQVNCSLTPADCPSPAEAVYYLYDNPTVPNSKGRLTRVDDASGSTFFESYDQRGRLLKTEKRISAGGQSRTATTYFEYDTADRVKKTRYPDGEWVETEYDPSGQPRRLKNNGGHLYVSSARYDLLGRLTRLQHGNGVEDQRTYYNTPGQSQHRHLQHLATVKMGIPPAVYLGLTFEQYSVRGQIGRVVDGVHSSGPLSNRADYSYDALGRLTGLPYTGVGSGFETSYAYDNLGRITQKGSRAIHYHDGARPHWVTEVHQGTQSTPIAHDLNGNRTRARGGNPDYTYDAWDRLKSVAVSTGSVEFVYDYSGRRVAKLVHSFLGTGVTFYYSELAELSGNQLFKSYYLGGLRVASQRKSCTGCELAALTPTEAVRLAAVSLKSPALVVLLRRDVELALAAALVLFGTGVLLAPWKRRRVVGITLRHGQVIVVAVFFLSGTFPWPILLRPAEAQCGNPPTPTPGPTPTATPVSVGEVRHYHVDHLGSVQVVTDAAGAMVEQIRYQPYGEVRGRFDGLGNPITNPSAAYRYEFTGYESEILSGLMYAGARFYDPTLGLFLTQDPARQFASPYSYGGGDPLNWTDPTGTIFGLDDLVIAIVLITAAAAAIDVGVRTGDIGAAFKAFAITGAVGLATAAVGAYGLGVLKAAVSPATYSTTVTALKVAGVAAGGYGTYQAASNGMYATAAVTAALTAFSAYGLLREMQGSSAAQGNNRQMIPDKERRAWMVSELEPAQVTQAADTRAQAVYGETASLRPQPNNPGSAADLRTAREWIADVSERNANVRLASPNPNNPIEMRVWDEAVRASQAAQRWNLPSDVRHFFMRQEGIGLQQPWWAQGRTPYQTFGPFVVPRGGAIPPGNRVYIDFYRGVP